MHATSIVFVLDYNICLTFLSDLKLTKKNIYISPFGVNFVDSFIPKHTHYTLTKIQKVKKYNRTPLRLNITNITFLWLSG